MCRRIGGIPLSSMIRVRLQRSRLLVAAEDDLDAPIEFDPSRHGVMPLAVAEGEPEQFLILDARS